MRQLLLRGKNLELVPHPENIIRGTILIKVDKLLVDIAAC